MRLVLLAATVAGVGFYAARRRRAAQGAPPPDEPPFSTAMPAPTARVE